jgi:pectin methylesterase-like acyl-CoA thioesterase
MKCASELQASASAAALLFFVSCAGRGELLGSRDPPARDAGAPSDEGAISDADASGDASDGDAANDATTAGDAGASDGEAGVVTDAIAPTETGSVTTKIVVAGDGSGQFLTVQSAVDSLPMGNAAPVEIDVKAGTYDEKVTLANRSFVSLVGDDPLTTIITFNQDANAAGGTAKSASVSISASDFSAKNITFQNSTPASGAQAVALFVNGSRQQFSNCRFISYQDTIYASTGSQYFRDCYVQGSDDYVIGAATAVFQSCTLYNAAGGVAVTAPNTDPATPFGFVFFGGALTASSSVATGSVALGRPWGPYGSATYVGTSLGAHIIPVGWVPFSPNNLTNARFSEYQTTGPGADPASRADASRQLTATEAAALTLSNLYGGWVPSFSQ